LSLSDEYASFAAAAAAAAAESKSPDNLFSQETGAAAAE
jgi:hypothetical protein